jgi:hypothetical protein
MKPLLTYETRYDLRAARILGMIHFFRTDRFARAVPVVADEIIGELIQLMPTKEQIAHSRECSPDRYMKLRPVFLVPTTDDDVELNFPT